MSIHWCEYFFHANQVSCGNLVSDIMAQFASAKHSSDPVGINKTLLCKPFFVDEYRDIILIFPSESVCSEIKRK